MFSESSPQFTTRGMTVYTGVRDAILRHALAPATKLSEDELGGIYGVSRTIVRSALQALSRDRLVVLEPNRGAFVAQPSTREAREVFEARALLEPKVAEMAAGIATHAHAHLLRDHLTAEHAATANGNDGEAIMLSAKFHVAIAEIADHAIYTEFVRDLCSRSSLIIALYWKRRDTTCESHAHHALVEAIAMNRPDDAAELMTSHLVDLLSGLDLTEKPAGSASLAEALAQSAR